MSIETTEAPDFEDPYDEINKQIDMYDRVRALEAQAKNHALLITELLGMVGISPEFRDAIRELEEEDGEDDDTN